jgi:hypothetical protein
MVELELANLWSATYISGLDFPFSQIFFSMLAIKFPIVVSCRFVEDVISECGGLTPLF